MPSHSAEPAYYDENGVVYIEISWIGLYSIKFGDTNTEFCDERECSICNNNSRYDSPFLIRASKFKFDQYGITGERVNRVHYQGE